MKHIKNIIPALLICMGFAAFSQEVVVTDSTAIQDPMPEATQVMDSVNFQKYKVDGIAAVVGEYVILDSDVDLMKKELQSQGASIADVTDCELVGSLMENKLYAHQAIQDSIIVSNDEVRNIVNQKLAAFESQVGSMEKLVEFFKKDSEEDLRAEMMELTRQGQLSSKMQSKIVDNVEITPDEVRAYFNALPEDKRPEFGDEVEISQIVIKPEIPTAEKQKIIDKLNEMREDVVDNDASFNTKAIMYSQDPGSSGEGGEMIISRKDGLDKTFKDVAFSLKEGEVSEPFESQFGFHIIKLERKIGQNLEIRHILLIPDVTGTTREKAKTQIDSLRLQLSAGKMDFAQTAKKFSDEKETAANNGKLINPTGGDTRFELTKIDPELYQQISDLNEGEITLVLTEQDRTGRPFYKIIKLDKKYPAHKAEFAKDYLKIQDLALRAKQIKAIEKWQKGTIAETYVKINGKYRNCEYTSNWLKK